MGKEADPTQDSSASEQEHAEQASEGEAKGLPDSGRHESETVVHRDPAEGTPAKP